jgi:1-phosphofructokinase
LNLAIDLFIETERLVAGVVNRTNDDDIQANGKGVNVSLILKMLGIDSTTLGFKAGFTGNYIDDYLAQAGINTDFIEVPGVTRINVFTRVNEEKTEYKLVNKGPLIPEEKVSALLSQISGLKKGDYLCLSGSFPRGVDADILIEISKICHEKGIQLIIDSAYPEVMACLKYQPFLLKPNEDELAVWLGEALENRLDYLRAARKLIEQGARNVLLSLGSQGAIFMKQDMCLSANSPVGEVVNTACAGDSLLGTFLAGILKKKELNEILQTAVAAGSSTAFRKGLTDFSDVEALKKQITIRQL